MPLRDLESWMWTEACAMIDRAERLHRQFFRPASIQSGMLTWEPPIDIYETRHEFKIMIALPGVSPEHLKVMLENEQLIISGKRNFPLSAEAEIRRVEIPYGRFERSIELPVGQFEIDNRELVNGCLLVTLRKI